MIKGDFLSNAFSHPCQTGGCKCTEYIYNGPFLGECARKDCGHSDLNHGLNIKLLDARDFLKYSNGGLKISDDWDVIASIASDLVFGFDITGSAFDDSGFKTINDKLDGIQSSINQLDKKIDTVIDLVKQLPKEIASIVNASLADEWIRTAIGLIGSLRQNTKTKATYEANRQNVSQAVDNLATAIYQVWGHQGSDWYQGAGWLAAATTSSALGAWAQFQSTVLLDPVLHPEHPSIQDNWLFKYLQDTFVELMKATKSAKSTGEDLIINTPNPYLPVPEPGKNTWIFDTSTGLFRVINSLSYSAELYFAKFGFPVSNWDRWELWASIKTDENQWGPQFLCVGSLPPTSSLWVDRANVIAAASAWPILYPQFPFYQKVLAVLKNSEFSFKQISAALLLPMMPYSASVTSK